MVTYDVVPMTDAVGMVQFVGGTVTLRDALVPGQVRLRGAWCNSRGVLGARRRISSVNILPATWGCGWWPWCAHR